jgi:hypothetical protein
MNIFILHEDPVVAAQMQCDKHVPKMVVESAQMLSTAHRMLDGTVQIPHQNPVNVWFVIIVYSKIQKWIKYCTKLCTTSILVQYGLWNQQTIMYGITNTL